MRIQHLQTNHMTNPMGYVLNGLHFSWTVEDTEGTTDQYTRIVIAKDEQFDNVLFDTGKLPNLGHPYFEPEYNLKPDRRYYWRVTIRTDINEECTSDTAWFETPVAGEWKADWIRAVGDTQAMPRIYKNIEVGKGLRRAVIRCCGYGLYECSINGQKTGSEYLMPGYYSYDLLNQYQTYDVTQELKSGSNQISFILGNGWYKGRFVFEGGYTNLYGDELKLIAWLQLQYEDGTEENIYTDDSWQAEESSIYENGIYDGERIDTTAPGKALKTAIVSGSRELAGRSNVPLTITESIPVKTIITTPAGEMVIDFGEAVTGWVEVLLPKDTKADFVLQYSELLQNGCFYNDNLRTAKAEFVYKGVSDGEYIRPHFTYYGFRYIKVTGLDKVTPDMFIARRIMSQLEPAGTLVTSNEKVNTLIDNALRSQKCNFIDMPLDCPQRDERMGWTGDISVFARTASYQMDCTAFLVNYMRNLHLEQEKLHGAVPFFVPLPKVTPYEGINPFLVTAGACVWGDAATIVSWEMYLHTRDKKLLKEFYPVMRDWVRFIEDRVRINEKPYLWQNDRHLGDWLALDNGNINNPIGRTDQGFIASAYFYYSTTLCAKAAKELGFECDYSCLTRLAAHIKEAFIKEYFDNNGELTTEKTQTAYALAIHFGLYDDRHKQVLVNGMKKAFQEYNGHLSTGFVGTSVLCSALSGMGLNDMAYGLLLNEEYPGWIHEVNLGATSIWERWNSLDDNGNISSNGMNSLNHYAYGCIVGWMYEYMCGYTWQEDGELIIRPMPDAQIANVNSSYISPYGKVSVSWEYQTNNKVLYDIVIPFQGRVKLELPDGSVHTLTAGRYVYIA